MNKKKSIFLDSQKTKITEDLLTDLLDFIKSKQWSLDEDYNELNSYITDGRILSAVQEMTIAKPIISQWIERSEMAKSLEIKLEIPEARNWTDINLVSDKFHIFIPINIKISNFKQSDNLNCYPGIHLAGTGIFSRTLENPFPTHCKSLYDKVKSIRVNDYDQPIDFYFIVFNKVDIAKSLYTSLLTIKELNSNGANKPFQANWGRNAELGRYSLIPVTDEMIKADMDRGLVPRVFREYKDSLDYVLDIANESERKSIESAKLNMHKNNMIRKKMKHAYEGIS